MVKKIHPYYDVEKISVEKISKSIGKNYIIHGTGPMDKNVSGKISKGTEKNPHREADILPQMAAVQCLTR